MIKSITAINYRGESIKLEMTRPEKSGFIIKDITGLFKPPKANINTTKIATLDGASYNSSHLDQRNVQLILEFMDTKTESIEDIRLKSYKYFPINKKVRLVVETDNRIVETEGVVEDNDPQVFNANEYTTITILCSDPYLYSPISNVTVFSGVKPAFKFPFSNKSLTEPTLKMATIESKTEANVYYDGDFTVGLTITIHAIGEATNLTIYNVTARESMRIDTNKLATLTGSGIITGDTITINTQARKKSITLLRDGVTYNIQNTLDRGTKWLSISEGDNVFAYRAETGATNLQFRMSYKTVYEGV